MARKKDPKLFLSGSPTFGSVIRGFRLGYHWSHRHGCFIRIGGDGPPWEIRLAPNGGIPSRATGEHFRPWWENDKPDEVLSMIAPLQNVRSVKRLIMFFVDDEGQRV